MRTLKVQLLIRVRLSSGRYAYATPVSNRSGSLREGYALVEGKPESHPEGVYYLRFLQGRKRTWQAVGPGADKAITALRNQQHDLEAISLGRRRADLAASRPDASVINTVEAFLSEVRRFRMPKTIVEYERMLGAFRDRFRDRVLSSITREDLLNYRAALEGDGKSPRTVFNHIMRISVFLRANGITGLLKAHDKPAYDEPEAEAYDADQLEALFAAAGKDDRLLFEFFLKIGFRDQEVMFSTWKNVDFKGKVIKVRSKPELGFRIKDKEERSVPVPDELIAALAARKQKSESIFIFPGANDTPNRHFLRILKSLARRAGLNCGECVNKSGQSCRKCAMCSEWGLHKFRKTFATMHSDAGVPAPTIQRWLGHSDLATTLRYLAIADMRSEKTRTQVNATFAGLRAVADSPMTRSALVETQGAGGA
ncbi:MAG: site-specific integrase [Acidobacteriaceae bacterium]